MDWDKILQTGFAAALVVYLLTVDGPRQRAEWRLSLRDLQSSLDALRKSVDDWIRENRKRPPE